MSPASGATPLAASPLEEVARLLPEMCAALVVPPLADDVPPAEDDADPSPPGDDGPFPL
jgi:hypothetical protein